MSTRAAFVSLLAGVPILGRGAASLRRKVAQTLLSVPIIRVSGRTAQTGVSVLLLFIAMLPASVIAADEAKVTVKLDGKTLFVPEIQLTRKINPITSLLYIGSWTLPDKTQADEKSQATLDLENNSLTFESTEKLMTKPMPRVFTRNTLNSYLERMNWGNITRKGRHVTQFAFRAVSARRQPAMIEMYADCDVAVFLNGQLATAVAAGSILAAGGRGYLPIMLDQGENIISVDQYSFGKPRIELSIRLDHLHDLQAAWQAQNGLLKRLVVGPKAHAVVDWSPNLGRFSVSAEVRDVATDKIVIRKNSLHRNMALDDGATVLAPGVYEVTYGSAGIPARENASQQGGVDVFRGQDARARVTGMHNQPTERKSEPNR